MQPAPYRPGHPGNVRYNVLEAEGYKYTIRLPANSVLQESIA